MSYLHNVFEQQHGGSIKFTFSFWSDCDNESLKPHVHMFIGVTIENILTYSPLTIVSLLILFKKKYNEAYEITMLSYCVSFHTCLPVFATAPNPVGLWDQLAVCVCP
jgi:hypothetical protein